MIVPPSLARWLRPTLLPACIVVPCRVAVVPRFCLSVFVINFIIIIITVIIILIILLLLIIIIIIVIFIVIIINTVIIIIIIVAFFGTISARIIILCIYVFDLFQVQCSPA